MTNMTAGLHYNFKNVFADFISNLYHCYISLTQSPSLKFVSVTLVNQLGTGMICRPHSLDLSPFNRGSS